MGKINTMEIEGDTELVALAYGALGDPPTPVDDGHGMPVRVMSGGLGEYETVAAGSNNQVLGGAGAVGDYLSHLIVIPATAAAGAVSIKDGAGAAITLFAGGGTTPLPTLAPITIFLGMKSAAGAWSVTTGANVSAIGVGDFT